MLKACNIDQNQKVSEEKFDVLMYYMNRLEGLDLLDISVEFIEKTRFEDSSVIYILQPERCNVCQRGDFISINNEIERLQIPTLLLIVSNSENVFSMLYQESSFLTLKYITLKEASKYNLDFVENMRVVFRNQEIIGYKIVK